jgi:hypothetical protein
MPRFIILRHEDTGGVHFDFMVETGDVLRTWRLPEPPRPGVAMSCEALPDHRQAYLDYQGPVSGDRGSVTRWDWGEYQVVRQSTVLWEVHLAGEKLLGTATFCRQLEDSSSWLCRFDTD